MTKYKLNTMRRKAYKLNYKISKGFQRYWGGDIYRNYYGEPFSGYNVIDLRTGHLVYDCYNSNYDHVWKLEDVEDFLKSEYKKAGMTY